MKICKDFYNNFYAGDSSLYGMFCISFDEEHKGKIKTTDSLPLENYVSNKEVVSIKLSEFINNNIGNVFYIETRFRKWKLYPKWIKKEFPESIQIRKYLKSICLFPDHVKKIKLKNEELSSFLFNFIDYPLKYHYQDLYIFIENSPIIISISHHGSLWIISKNLKKLKPLYFEIKSVFDSIVVDDVFRKFISEESNTCI